MGKACVFFDRDGIANRYPGEGKYVERIEEFHLLPEFFDALRVVGQKGYEAVIVTNQRGVALGRMSMETVNALHQLLVEEVRKAGLHLLDILVCTHGDNAHPNRKPNPGMLLEAAEKYGLDLRQSWMVGDSERDVIAGKRAGCKTLLVGPLGRDSTADHRIAELGQLAGFLEKHLEPRV
jgi:D-glycero-D-manno-heptose 1,7-bisphosphate phosphatase